MPETSVVVEDNAVLCFVGGRWKMRQCSMCCKLWTALAVDDLLEVASG